MKHWWYSGKADRWRYDRYEVKPYKVKYKQRIYYHINIWYIVNWDISYKMFKNKKDQQNKGIAMTLEKHWRLWNSKK